MPGHNGTGPTGQGPRTGRGMGNCSTGRDDLTLTTGYGRGRRGGGRGCRGGRRGFANPWQPDSLATELAELRRDNEELRKRLDELTNKK